MLQLIQQNYQKVLAYQSQRGTNDGFDKKNGLLLPFFNFKDIKGGKENIWGQEIS